MHLRRDFEQLACSAVRAAASPGAARALALPEPPAGAAPLSLRAQLALLAALEFAAEAQTGAPASALPRWIERISSAGFAVAPGRAGFERDFFALAVRAAARNDLRSVGVALADALLACGARAVVGAGASSSFAERAAPSSPLGAAAAAVRAADSSLRVLTALLTAIGDSVPATLSAIGTARLRLSEAALALLSALPLLRRDGGVDGAQNCGLLEAEQVHVASLGMLALRALMLPAGQTPGELLPLDDLVVGAEAVAESCVSSSGDPGLRAAATELLVAVAVCSPHSRERVASTLKGLLGVLVVQLQQGPIVYSPPADEFADSSGLSDDLLLLRSLLAGLVRLVRLSPVAPMASTGSLDISLPAVDGEAVSSLLQVVSAAVLANSGGHSPSDRSLRQQSESGSRQRGWRPVVPALSRPDENSSVAPRDSPDIDRKWKGLRNALVGGICALMAAELGIGTGGASDGRARGAPAAARVPAAVFDASAAVSTMYEFSRELAATRKLSVSPAGLQLHGSRVSAAAATAAASAASAATAALTRQRHSGSEPAQQKLKMDACDLALDRCSELISVIVHIASACDHSGLTAVAASAVLDVWVNERTAMASLETKVRSRVGLQRPLGTGDESAPSTPSDIGVDAPTVSAGFFSRMFGGGTQSRLPSQQESLQLGPSLAMVLAAPAHYWAARAASLTEPRFTLWTTLVAALARLSILRSGGSRTSGAYAVASEALVTVYIQQASGLGAASSITHTGLPASSVSDQSSTQIRLYLLQAAIASALTAVSRGLGSAAAAASLEARGASSDPLSRREALKRLDDEVVIVEGKRADFRQRLLALAMQLGSEAFQKDAGGGSSVANNAALLGAVLPALAHALAPTTELSGPDAAHNLSDRENHFYAAMTQGVPQRSSAASVRVYRSLWLALIALRLADSSGVSPQGGLRRWPSQWLRAVRAIAVHTPVLVVRPHQPGVGSGGGATNLGATSIAFAAAGPVLFDADLSVAGSGTDVPVSDVAVAEMRAHLAASFPADLRTKIAGLPGHQIAFLRSALALEKLRASAGTCKAPFSYLLDPTIEQEGLGPLAECLIDVVFESFVHFAVRLGSGPASDAILSDHLLYFLSLCAHRFPRVRRAAFRVIVALIERFPRLMWSEVSLRAVLDTVELLSRRVQQGNGPPPRIDDSASHPSWPSGANSVLMSDPYQESGTLQAASSPYAIHAPGSQAELTDVLADMTEFACQWALRAMAAAPFETRTLFQRFLSQLALASANTSNPPSSWIAPGSRVLQEGAAHAGLLVGMYGVAPPWGHSAGPIVRPFGMSARLQSASQSLLGRAGAPSSFAAQLGMLASSDARVRFGGVGVTAAGTASAHSGSVAPTASGQKAAGSVVGSVTTSERASRSAGVAGPVAGATVRPSGISAPYAGASSLRTLDGFYATSWARPARAAAVFSTNAQASKALSSHRSIIGSVFDEESERGSDDGDNEDDIDQPGGDDVDSISDSITLGAPALRRADRSGMPPSLNPRVSSARPPPGPGRGSVAGGASQRAGSTLSASFAMNPAAGSAEEVVAAAVGLCGESVKVLLRVPIDPLSLLGNRLAPELAGLLERRSHYLGQIEGMAALHAGDIRGRARKNAPQIESVRDFDVILQRDLAESAGSLLVLAQLEWREALIASLATSCEAASAAAPIHPSPGGSAAALSFFDADVINDTVGAVPAGALPSILGPANLSVLGSWRVRRLNAASSGVVIDADRSAAATVAGLQPKPSVADSRSSFQRFRQRFSGARPGAKTSGDSSVGRSLEAESHAVEARRSAGVSEARAASAPPAQSLGRSSPLLDESRSRTLQSHSAAVVIPTLVTAAIDQWEAARRPRGRSRRRRQQRELEGELTRTLYRIAAYLVWLHSEDHARIHSESAALQRAREFACEKLLPLLVWLPVRVFTAFSVSVATECWSWLLAGNTCPAHVRARLMSEVASAWAWTVSLHLGLFSGTAGTGRARRSGSGSFSLVDPPPRCSAGIDASGVRPGEAAVLQPRSALPAGLSDSEPHRLLILFFEERLRVCRFTSNEELAHIATIVVAAAGCHASQLSTSPAAFGAHVRLLHLELGLLQTAQYSAVTQPRIKANRAEAALQPRPRVSLGSVGGTVGGVAGVDSSIDSFAQFDEMSTYEAADEVSQKNLDAIPSDLLLALESSLLSEGPYYIRTGLLDSVAQRLGLDEFGTPIPSRIRNGGAERSQPSRPSVLVAPWASTCIGSLPALRERIFQALFAWFELAPSRYEAATSAARVREDFPFIVDLARLIRRDAHFDVELPQAVAPLLPAKDGSVLAHAHLTSPGAQLPMSPTRTVLKGGSSPTGPGSTSSLLRRAVLNRLPAANAGLASLGGSHSPIRPASPSTDEHVLVSDFTPSAPPINSRRLFAHPETVRSGFSVPSGSLPDATPIPASAPEPSPNSSADGVQVQSALRDLALLFLGHEIDRIVAWHNPLDVEERRLPAEREFSIEATLATLLASPEPGGVSREAGASSASISNSSETRAFGGAASSAAGVSSSTTFWTQLTTTAWGVSPRLALRLAQRLRGVREVAAQLSHLIRADPLSVRNEPSALLYFVTPDAVLSSSPQLQLLNSWAPAPLPVLLELMSRCSVQPASANGAQAEASFEDSALPSVPQSFLPPLFAHPMVGAYVVRCLSLFPIDTLSFFLPQIVQALRHDSNSVLSDFLCSLSATSLSLAQELLWLLASEGTGDSGLEFGDLKAARAAAMAAANAHLRASASASAASVAGDSGGSHVSGSDSVAQMGTLGGASPHEVAESHGFQRQIPGTDPLPARAMALSLRVFAAFSPSAREVMELQLAFWDQVTNISGRLKTEVADKSQRRVKIREFLRDLQTEARRDLFYARDRVRRNLAALEASQASAAKTAGLLTPAASSTTVVTKTFTAPGHGLLLAGASAEQAKRPLPLAGAASVLGGVGTDAAAEGVALPLDGAASDSIDIAMPTNPYLRLVSVDLESGRPMQSAAKCPFRLTFSVEKFAGPDAALRKRESRQLPSRSTEIRSRAEQFVVSALSDGGTILRARLGAQHAALVMRRRMHRQRVQVGLRLERTRERVGEGLRRLTRLRSAAPTSEGVAAVGVVTREAGGHASAGVAVAAVADATRAGVDVASVHGPESDSDDSDVYASDDVDEDVAYAEADGARRASDDEGEFGDLGHPNSQLDRDEDEGIADGFASRTSATAASDADEQPEQATGASQTLTTAPIATEAVKARPGFANRLSLASISRKLKELKVSPRQGLRMRRRADVSVQSKGYVGVDEVGLDARLSAAVAAGDGASEGSDEDEHAKSFLPEAGPSLAPEPDVFSTSCIFKVFDDCRQDALAMQFISLCRAAFDDAPLGLGLFPYRVVATRTGSARTPGGILECVPDVRSRDEIGKAGFRTLHDYFVSAFGRPDGAEFEVARRNLSRSLAAYAVVCFLLRIKDRHNGNLLVSGRGHLVHIDFGFLLGISPGGNLGFETAAFKLTQEMIDVLGGSVDTEAFMAFTELSCRAFLLARDHADALGALVAGMADSNLPCFFFADTLPRLRSRFRPDESDLRATRFWRGEVLAAAKSVTTTLYDGIQSLQQGIAY